MLKASYLNYISVFIIVILFNSIVVNGNIISNTTNVEGLEISYITDFPENAIEIRQFTLILDLTIKFPEDAKINEISVYQRGVKVTSEIPQEFSAGNNNYAIDKSEYVIEQNLISFQYSVIINFNLLSNLKDESIVYFSPYLEFRGSYDNPDEIIVETIFTYLTSFKSDGIYTSQEAPSVENSSFNFFLYGGILIISTIIIYFISLRGKDSLSNK